MHSLSQKYTKVLDHLGEYKIDLEKNICSKIPFVSLGDWK
jgi:hypothetical protein